MITVRRLKVLSFQTLKYYKKDCMIYRTFSFAVGSRDANPCIFVITLLRYQHISMENLRKFTRAESNLRAPMGESQGRIRINNLDATLNCTLYNIRKIPRKLPLSN
jgi:hypothetical protein